jgi:hypothetical protein
MRFSCLGSISSFSKTKKEPLKVDMVSIFESIFLGSLSLILLALIFRVFTLVGAEEELSVEKLHGYDGKDELEQDVHDQDVDHILQGVDDAIEDSLKLRHTLDGFQGAKHTQYSQRLNC